MLNYIKLTKKKLIFSFNLIQNRDDNFESPKVQVLFSEPLSFFAFRYPSFYFLDVLVKILNV